MIAAFAFARNISHRTLSALSVSTKLILPSRPRPKDVEQLLIKLQVLQPQFILGLGQYSRRDKDKLRIETQCSSPEKVDYKIDSFLSPSTNAKFAKGIGNSSCNRVCLEIIKAVKIGLFNSQFTFVHIPKTFDPAAAACEIEKMVVNA